MNTTTQTKQHTALPWGIWLERQVCHAVGPQSLEGPNICIADSPANASFIVRACNSHYELLEACKATMEEFEDRYDGSPDGGYKWMGILMHQLQAAIALAERREQ